MRQTLRRVAYRTPRTLLRPLYVLAMIATVTVQGCSLNDLVDGSALPSNMKDPKVVKNAAGAIALYNDAILAFSTAVGWGSTGEQDDAVIGSFISVSGIFTDELQVSFQRLPNAFPTSSHYAIDSRTVPENEVSGRLSEMAARPYLYLHTVRASAREAIGALHKYVPDTSRVRIGHLYAIEAVAEVLLAELYCSGIPLSTMNFESDYTLTGAISSEGVYRHALTLLDSALMYALDSPRITNLVKVTRGRALLALGDYEAAANAVASVPVEYRYELTYSNNARSFFFRNVPCPGCVAWAVTVADRKGQNGAPYVSGNDPRTATITLSPTVQFPLKYATTGLSPIILSSGVEARLIEAEAALQANDTTEWLRVLNALRTSGTFTVTTNPGNPAVQDTVWVPGTGAVLFTGQLPAFPGLRPLADPGADTARVSMLFAERAAWLFLTGHRQGDLRRMVRQYRRDEATVYPSGLWGPQRLVTYGSDVTLPAAFNEQQRNPLYHGCLSREA